VAVFETHMDNNADATMKPSTSRGGELPIAITVRSAIRRCRFQRCIAWAIMNPPRKRYTRLLA